MQLGEILVGRGLVSTSTVQRIIQRQQNSGERFNDLIVKMNVMTESELEAVIASVRSMTPSQPRLLAETGIAEGQLLELMLKFMRLQSLEAESDIARAMRLPTPVIRQLIAMANQRGLVQAMGTAQSRQFGDIRYVLSEQGRAEADDAENRNSYLGPAPVSLAAFERQVLKQRISNEVLTPENLRDGLEGLVFPEHYIRKLLPAINSGRSVLLFGPSGNGKSTFAKRIADLFEDVVYIPYAIEIAGQIIKIFDHGLHRRVIAEQDSVKFENFEIGAETYDDRWVACRRPFAIAGGDLTLDMLDLQYDSNAKFYDAPLHVKALNGIFLIDDFGRQRFNPKDLLNRWIVPMENHIDYLKLHTGTTFSFPFDELLIFSTNIDPAAIMDPALLRRLPYKIKLLPPDEEEFKRLFEMEAKRLDLTLDNDVVDFVIDLLAKGAQFGLAYFQPKFVCEQAAQICNSFPLERRVTCELAIEALANLYVEIESVREQILEPVRKGGVTARHAAA